MGQMQIFPVGSHQFRESLRELLRELWFPYCSSREMPFPEWDLSFRELLSEFRELLREYPGTLRELREWPFHSERVFPDIGVVPRLLKYVPAMEQSEQTRRWWTQRLRTRKSGRRGGTKATSRLKRQRTRDHKKQCDVDETRPTRMFTVLL